MADPLKIVIVGGVAAGPKAAARARRLDPQARITILEKGDYISYSACGLPFLISGEIPDVRHLLASPVGVMRDAEYFRQVKDINFLTGKEVLAIDRLGKLVQVRDLASGQEETYPYDKLVLATGAVPVRPQPPTLPKDNAVFFIGRECSCQEKVETSLARLQHSVWVWRRSPRQADPSLMMAGLLWCEIWERIPVNRLFLNQLEVPCIGSVWSLSKSSRGSGFFPTSL